MDESTFVSLIPLEESSEELLAANEEVAKGVKWIRKILGGFQKMWESGLDSKMIDGVRTIYNKDGKVVAQMRYTVTIYQTKY